MKFRFYSALTALILLTASTLSADDWPQWRGPYRTDISPAEGLMQQWPADGPELVWQYEQAGLGYSSFAIVDDKLFTMGTRNETEHVFCLDANTGNELWTTEVGPFLENGWGGGPRSTPAVDGEFVYVLSGKGHLACLAVENGNTKWNVDITELGGKIPNWGYSESVLVDGDKVLCTPGAKDGTVMAFNKINGEVLWKAAVTANIEKDGETKQQPAKAHYSSIMPAIMNGEPQYVQLTQNTLFGIQAGSGKVLWQTPWPPGRVAVIPTPLIKDNYVYITSGYGAGCKLVKVNQDYSVDEIYFNNEMKNHHGGVILLGETIYGHSDAGWIAQDFMSGETLWRERRELGKGCVTFAEGHLYCVDEKTGTVALVEATREEYREKSRFDLPEKSDIRSPKGKVWTHPVVINGKLYLRDQEYIFCYDVSDE